MKAAVENVKQVSETSSHGQMVSINFNGVTVAFAHSESEFTSFSDHYIPSTIKAPKVLIEVGGDFTIRGAYISGQKVDVHVDKQLIIESLKDTNYADSDTESVSFGVSISWAG